MFTKIRRVSICLLAFTLLIPLGGCPHLPVADPSTESRLSNQSRQANDVELTLDPQKYGMKTSDVNTELAQEWLMDFKAGDGVEIINLDAGKLIGRYRIASNGFMIVHFSLGTKPRFQFNKMKLTRAGNTVTYNGEQNIAGLFQPTDEPHRYRFRVTKELFSIQGVSSAGGGISLVGPDPSGQE